MTDKQFKVEQLKALRRQEKLLEEDRKALTEKHKEYLRRDIIEIYSAMAVVLFDNGNSVDEIAELIGQIQQEWTKNVERGAQTMREYCMELTGIDLEDMTV